MKMAIIILSILLLFFMCTTGYFYYQYKKEQIMRKALGSEHLQKFTNSLMKKFE